MARCANFTLQHTDGRLIPGSIRCPPWHRVGSKRVVHDRAAQALPSRQFDLAESTMSTAEARAAQPILELARAARSVATPPPAAPADLPLPSLPVALLAAAGLALAGYGVKKLLDTPSRTYDGNVGQEYDAWTEEGVLEYYWGEHIHLGYYTPEERVKGYKRKDFIQAKYDFVDEMLRWSGASGPATVLDVGCGIGGTSRYLAAKFPWAQVTGITLSPNQVRRATELAQQRSLPNAEFRVMDALAMDFPDDSFDLVWACESGEHMPDKAAYVAEMVRVLKPGGTLALATWCQREETPEAPLSEDDQSRLKFLYNEWAHPYFVSKEEYGRIAAATGALQDVVIADWTAPTINSWRHSVWVGVWDPWMVVFKGPRIWYKTVREIVTLERMHCAFADGLMEYGMMKAVKRRPSGGAAPSAGEWLAKLGITKPQQPQQEAAAEAAAVRVEVAA